MTCGCFSVDQSAPPERDGAAERAAWLESLEPGDTVAVLNLTSLSERYGCTIRQIHEISSVQRQISLYGISIRFDRRGRSYNGGNIMLAPVTDEVLVHVRRMRLVREIQNWDLDSAPAEVLEKLRAVQVQSGIGARTESPGLRSKQNTERAHDLRDKLGV